MAVGLCVTKEPTHKVLEQHRSQYNTFMFCRILYILLRVLMGEQRRISKQTVCLIQKDPFCITLLSIYFCKKKHPNATTAQ